MKTLFLSITMLVSYIALGQEHYNKGMQKAFELWGQGKSLEASNQFERIATVEMDNWVPYYYVAFVNATEAFAEKDAKKLAQKLGKAQEFADVAAAISTDNPELLVLQAMIHTAWIASDGAKYGMELSGKVAQLYEKAYALAPENPRVVYCRAEWNIGSARYFGKDIAPYCDEIEKSMALFANFKPEGAYYPDWGLDRAQKLSEACTN